MYFCIKKVANDNNYLLGIYSNPIAYDGGLEYTDEYCLIKTMSENAHDNKNNLGGFFTTWISLNNLGQKDRCMLALDIDSESEFAKTRDWLIKHQQRYCLVESSPQKYWVFCIDVIDEFKKVIDQAKVIPGVDKNWLAACENQGTFCFRAYRKQLYYPFFRIDNYPNFFVKDVEYLFYSLSVAEIDLIRINKQIPGFNIDPNNNPQNRSIHEEKNMEVIPYFSRYLDLN